MKAVILAGGQGLRLRPFTKFINKHLLPVGDKPLIYYSISLLGLSGIKEILIITSDNKSKSMMQYMLNYTIKKKVRLKYLVQKKPTGIPDAMKLAKNFLKNQKKKIFMLGDNFFHGHIFHLELKKLFNQESNFIFTQRVKNSSQFGVLRKKSNKTFFIEKPKNSKNEEAITGLYILDEDIFKFAHKLKKSKRQETEITDILKLYSKKNKLNIFNIGQGTFWVDGGTFKNLSMISDFINILEKRNIKKIGLL